MVEGGWLVTAVLARATVLTPLVAVERITEDIRDRWEMAMATPEDGVVHGSMGKGEWKTRIALYVPNSFISSFEWQKMGIRTWYTKLSRLKENWCRDEVYEL